LNNEQASRPFKLLMITSALTGEGKSIVACHLASFLAMMGKRVLLVDANLRNPKQHIFFQLQNASGLSNIIVETQMVPQAELYGQATDIPTLRVLTAGSIPANPSELLQSHLTYRLFEYFKSSAFDYVIVDAPPLLPVADAQILTSYISATLLVVDASKTPRKLFSHVKKMLKRSNVRSVGITITNSLWSDYSDRFRNSSNSKQGETDSVLLQTSMPLTPIMPPDPIQSPTRYGSPQFIQTHHTLRRSPLLKEAMGREGNVKSNQSQNFTYPQ
jgi:capsular exopolysaccharide synthesis family protein